MWIYSSILVFLPNGISGLMNNAWEVFACVIFAASVVMAWRWEILGGIWFILEGIVAPFYFQISSADEPTFIFAATIAPILLGILFIISWKQDEKSRVRHYSHTTGIGK